MIGYLRGLLLDKGPEGVLLDVQGVGYFIEVPAMTLCALPEREQMVALYIMTHVREDAIRLFGFLEEFDKKVFQELLSVSGIGPKAALTLLGANSGEELCHIIVSEDTDSLTLIPGIGPKTADRIVLEMKAKLQRLTGQSKRLGASRVRRKQDISLFDQGKEDKEDLLQDLGSALSNLGYKEKQQQSIVNHFKQKLDRGDRITLEEALKESLKLLSNHTKSAQL